jgi:hypothetical protein
MMNGTAVPVGRNAFKAGLDVGEPLPPNTPLTIIKEPTDKAP